MQPAGPIEPSSDDGFLIRVKAVPGASRSRIVGLLGDRLKIAVAVPPQAGRANQAIIELLAQTLGIPQRQITLISGLAQPQKTLHVAGCDIGQIKARLNL